MLLSRGLQMRTSGGGLLAAVESGTAFPTSGTSGTTVVNGKGAPPGSLYLATTNDCLFVNEGTQASPYWTPASFDQRGLMGWSTDFTDGTTGQLVDTTYVHNFLGVPVAVTETSVLLSNGIKLHGQGLDETDAGMTVAESDQGNVATLKTTNEDAHVTAMSVGEGVVPMFQPDQNGTMVIDVNYTSPTDLTATAAFCGFIGSTAAALNPVMTYSGTTVSFATTIGDDVAGLTWSSEMTDSDRWFAVHDKDNANATILTTATDVDTGVNIVADTYQRLRVECDANGTVRMFINKVLYGTFTAALEVTEEIQPTFYVESSAAAHLLNTVKLLTVQIK